MFYKGSVSPNSPNSSLVGIAIVTCDNEELNASEIGNLFLGKGSFSLSPLLILNNYMSSLSDCNRLTRVKKAAGEGGGGGNMLSSET